MRDKQGSERPMFQVWIRDELDVKGRVLTYASLDDVEDICRSMCAEGVTGYEDAEAVWYWVVGDVHAGLEIVLSETAGGA